MFKNVFLYLFLICFLFSACKHFERESASYSFFVAGHAYGKAGVDNDGLYPPFKQSFDLITSYQDMAFGVLNGDFLYNGSAQDWAEVERDLLAFDFPVHFVMGNHEYRRPNFLNQKIERKYYIFEKGNDLHIVLDGNPDAWNIKGEQFKFLRNVLNEKGPFAKRILVYVHQLIWWSPEGRYAEIRLNSEKGRDSISTFHSEIRPLLQQLEKPVYLFAGDVGAANWSDNCSYHIDENIHLISSGMGKDDGSNYLIVHVENPDSISINWVALSPDYEANYFEPEERCILD